VAGAVLLATVGAAGDGEDVALGLLLACGAGTVYAVYVAASAVLLDDHDAPDVAAVVLGGAGLVLIPVALTTHPGWVASPRGAAVALWLGLVTVALAYPLLARGLAGVGVGATSTLTLAEPAVAATLGLLVLDERLPAAGFVGLALVATGVVVEAVLARQQQRVVPPAT
jgi:DME family drug/metabolite transporter